jgi:single-strand DNA-binding protein
MNALVNRVQLIGLLGQDPEVKKFDKGQLAKFSLATSETYKSKQGEKVTETQWHNIVAFGKTAEVLEKYVKKGDKIAVEGKLVTRKWQTNEGENRYSTEVVVNDILMLSNKPKNA